MLELSKMQGCVVGSRAPLGLLLVCLHLSGMEVVLALGQEGSGGPLKEGVKAGWHTLGSLGDVRVGFGEVKGLKAKGIRKSVKEGVGSTGGLLFLFPKVSLPGASVWRRRKFPKTWTPTCLCLDNLP